MTVASTRNAKRAPARSPRTAAEPKTRSASRPSRLRVRMYRVGFGDFFLVTVPSNAGPKHILIDCGVTGGRTGKGDIAGIKTAVRHMAAETDRQLALVIATHRHQDHIIGFSRCAAEFAEFQIEAVWMPYWETEADDEVKSFQLGLQDLALDLRAAALAGADDENMEEILGIVENATGVSRAAKPEGPGGGTNAKSLAFLKHGLTVTPEYYYKGQTPSLPSCLAKAGLRAEILGPPKPGQEAFLRLNDLKKGVGQYLGAATSVAHGKRAEVTPFGSEYVTTAEAYPVSAFREWAPRLAGGGWDLATRNSHAMEQSLKAALPSSLLAAARKLDGALNNQSLVVLFTWEDKTLLFAGDAQAGNWQYWLYDEKTPSRDPSRNKLSAEGTKVLGALDFYKVGHHGSTNATPISAVEAMGAGFVAMCSTQHDTYGNECKGTEVPRRPLLAALEDKSTLVRSDQIELTRDDGSVEPAIKGSPRSLPTPSRGELVRGSCYIDYFL